MKRIVLVTIVLVALVLVGCTKSMSTPPVYVPETKEEVQISAPTETPLPTATSTIAPSPTQRNTSTPAPTATPGIEGMPEGAPFKDALYWAHLNGHVDSTSESPLSIPYESVIKRSQMALMYCKVIYEDRELVKGRGSFSDVKPEEYPELSACIEQLNVDGYIAGTSTSKLSYRPEKTLLKGELAVFHLRGLFNIPDSEEPGWSPPKDYEGGPWGNYTDAEWALYWGEYLIRNGYYSPYFGRFIAAEPATLEEVVMALYSIAHK